MVAVVFDMDGVIVDSEPHWIEREQELFCRCLPGWNGEQQRALVGTSMKDTFADLSCRYDLPWTWEEYAGEHEILAKEIYGSCAELIPGARELIDTLYAAGATLGIASSSPMSWIEIVVKRFAFAHCFSALASAEELCGTGKPSPDVYLLALKRLGAAAVCSVAIEDSEKGIQAAKAAGLKCIALKGPYLRPSALVNADLIVEDLRELSAEVVLALPGH